MRPDVESGAREGADGALLGVAVGEAVEGGKKYGRAIANKAGGAGGGEVGAEDDKGSQQVADAGDHPQGVRAQRVPQGLPYAAEGQAGQRD